MGGCREIQVQKRTKTDARWRYARARIAMAKQSFCCGTRTLAYGCKRRYADTPTHDDNMLGCAISVFATRFIRRGATHSSQITLRRTCYIDKCRHKLVQFCAPLNNLILKRIMQLLCYCYLYSYLPRDAL